MEQKDVEVFIEEMEEIGDEWTPEQVEAVYGDLPLDEALAKRKANVNTLFDIIGTYINYDEGDD